MVYTRVSSFTRWIDDAVYQMTGDNCSGDGDGHDNGSGGVNPALPNTPPVLTPPRSGDATIEFNL